MPEESEELDGRPEEVEQAAKATEDAALPQAEAPQEAAEATEEAAAQADTGEAPPPDVAESAAEEAVASAPAKDWSQQKGLDVQTAFSFVFKDEQWMEKIALGAIFSILSITTPIVLGWSVAITRNVARNEERPLPAWQHLGQMFLDGLVIIVVLFIYTLPFWLLLFLGGLAIGVASSTSDSGFLAATALVVTTCLLFLFGIALFFLSPAVVIQYARTDSFGACFRIGEVAAIARENLVYIVLITLLAIGVSIGLAVGSVILILIPCLGWLALMVLGLAAPPYLSAVWGHLFGQMNAQTPRTEVLMA